MYKTYFFKLDGNNTFFPLLIHFIHLYASVDSIDSLIIEISSRICVSICENLYTNQYQQKTILRLFNNKFQYIYLSPFLRDILYVLLQLEDKI